MSFFSKMQNALANWMQGRNGPDNLGFTALIAAIVFSLLSLFRLPLTSFLSMLCLRNLWTRSTPSASAMARASRS